MPAASLVAAVIALAGAAIALVTRRSYDGAGAHAGS